MPKTKRIVRIQAGRLGRVLIYSQALRTDPPKVRAAKSHTTTPGRAKINQRTRTEHVEELMAANFDRGDLFVTLTYRDAPPTRDAAMRHLSTFLRLLRAARRERGERLIYLKNAEHLRDDGSEGRWHHHLVVNGTGADYEEIRSLWSAWGDNVDFEGLLDDGEDYGSRARYLCKERPPAGKQCVTPSRGLKKPTRSSDLVDESLTITVDSLPAGAKVLDKLASANEWGEFIYYKFLVPYPEPVPDGHRCRGDGGT